MRSPEWATTTWEWTTSHSLYQLGLRLLLCLGVLGCYASVEGGIAGRQGWLLYGLVPLTALVIARPDSSAALVLLILPIVVWLVGAGSADTVSVPTLTFALSCLLVHVSTAHAALAPPGATFATATARGWLTRAATVGITTTLAWGLARYLTGRAQTGTAWLTGAAFALVLAFVAYLVTYGSSNSS